MRNIIITDNVDTITLLRDLEIDVTPKEISKMETMASGREVKDVVGYKPELDIPVGYLSLEDVAKLKAMIERNFGLLTISYPSPDGDKTAQFMVNAPTYTTFDYDDEGVAIWKGVTIKATAVEVAG